MTDPLVSVLVPCYNAEAYVGAALESVMAQAYSLIEVIVVDDGSTDGSAAVLEEFCARGVTVIRQDNRGAAAARNRALSRSSGQLVLWLDADDWIGPGHIAALQDRLSGDDQAIAFSGWGRFTGDPAAIRCETRPSQSDLAGTDWLSREWADGMLMMQSGMFLIPRSRVDAVGGWDESLGLTDDFEFFARLIAGTPAMRFAPGACLHYRSGVAGSLSGQTTRRAAESACRSLLLGTGHLLAAKNSARTRSTCARMLQNFEFEFYPAYADLRRAVRRRAAELGRADAEPSGPPAFHALRRWIGWKAARRVQHLAERLGLTRAGRARAAHG